MERKDRMKEGWEGGLERKERKQNNKFELNSVAVYPKLLIRLP